MLSVSVSYKLQKEVWAPSIDVERVESETSKASRGCIGVGGEGGAVDPPKFGRKKYFSGKHRAIFGQLI